GTNREVGIMTDVEAQEALLAANLEQAQQLRALLPDLERMTRLPGAMGEAARAMLVQTKNEIAILENTMTVFESTLKNGISEGLNKAIGGLVDGTMTLKEAIHELANTIAQSLLKMYAENFAQKLMQEMGGMMGGFMDAANQGANGAGGWLAAIFGNGAGVAAGGAATAVADTAKLAQEQALLMQEQMLVAQEMTAAATLATSGTALLASATALQGAAAALSASAASGGAGSALGSVASAAGGMMMATGGYTGPGGKHEPAGIVHKGEFVTRKAVTGQPGALAFLSLMNRAGFAAALRSLGIPGFASGGHVPAAPVVANPMRAIAASFNPQPISASMSANVDNRIALNLFDDPFKVHDFATARLEKTGHGEITRRVNCRARTSAQDRSGRRGWVRRRCRARPHCRR
ncbi:MAG: hypothetical protein LBF93_02290, partial [Zoogloeaceae bacterium]|nr:hypothetical protein [Zoogloeaceae bacterium]